MNSNICIISYYGPKDQIKLASDSLKNTGLNTYDFPLYKYMNDANDKKDNYFELLIDFIKKNNIKYLLWWYINIPLDKFYILKDITGVKYLFFNWDEPFNWNDCLLKYRSFYLDIVFVTCSDSLNKYLENGVKKAICLYPGFSSKFHYKITDIEYEEFKKYDCDISICCTNLYENEENYPNQYINRKKLIDDIYNNQNKYKYIFHIYGPSYLKKIYPESYKGFIQYNDQNKVFNYSKINLCTHVINNQGGYLNERMFLIGASYGLILVDHVKDIEKIFTPNEEVILLKKDNYIEQIQNILTNYKNYEKIKTNIGHKCHKYYTYDKWAQTISDNIDIM